MNRHVPIIMALLLPLVMPRPAAAQQPGEVNCISCHRELVGAQAEEGPVYEYTGSAHEAAGLTCADCHGGDPRPPADLESFDYTPAKGPGTGFRGAPSRREIPAFCGRCHSDPTYMRRFAPQQRVDQEAQYRISGHGMQLRQGNTRVATCVDCHGAHGILSASDPRSRVAPQNVPDTCGQCHGDESTMSGSQLSTTIPADYARGVHGVSLLVQGDVGAPACNDCHGNHGAAPPGLSSVSAVCSQCHVSNAQEFQASPHGPVFEMLGESACEACHSNHENIPTSDEMLAPDGVCSVCHAEGDVGWQVAAGMLERLTGLRDGIARAGGLLDEAHRKGILVEQGQLALRQAENGLVRGRVKVHSFSITGLSEVLDPAAGSAAEAEQMGVAALAEFSRRRSGWSVFLLLCVVAVVSLALLVRRIEGPGGSSPIRDPWFNP